MGGRGTVGRKDVNRVSNGFAVGGTDIPHIDKMRNRAQVRHQITFLETPGAGDWLGSNVTVTGEPVAFLWTREPPC